LAKNSNYKWLAIFLIVGIVGYYAFSEGYLNVPSGGNNGGPSASPGTGQQVANPGDMQRVSKPLKLVVLDFHGGAAATGTTNSIDVYAADGKTAMESDLDLSAGAVTTGNSYMSGTELWIAYYYDTTIDEHMWWNIVVPEMTSGDADSLTTNQITLKAFSEPAATDLMVSGAGTTYADAEDLNTTGSSLDTGTFTYTWFITNDNTGFLESHDPVYGVDNKAIVWATVSGTGYEQVTLTGWDGAFSIGTTKYYYHTLAPNEISKWKVGNDYEPGYSGTGSFTFSYSATGYSNSTTAYTTLQLYIEVYSDVPYMKEQVDYGPYNFALAETTVEIMDV
jgi:hypothetical protein